MPITSGKLLNLFFSARTRILQARNLGFSAMPSLYARSWYARKPYGRHAISEFTTVYSKVAKDPDFDCVVYT